MVGLPEPEYGTDRTFVWITFKRPRYVTNSVTQTLHETTDSEESGQKKMVRKVVRKTAKQPSNKFTF